MHYLKDGRFQGHRGQDDNSIGDTLAGLAGQYVPIQGLTLKTAEIRKLNKAIDVLEADAEDGYFAIEDEDFRVLKRVAVSLAENSSLARSAPIIEDILNGASTEEPERSKMSQLREATGD